MEFHVVLQALKEKVCSKSCNALIPQAFSLNVEVVIKNIHLHHTKFLMTFTVMELHVDSVVSIFLIHGLTSLIRVQTQKQLAL